MMMMKKILVSGMGGVYTRVCVCARMRVHVLKEKQSSVYTDVVYILEDHYLSLWVSLIFLSCAYLPLS